VKTWLLQARQDAEQLLHMIDDQLGQLSVLDLQVQTRYAYSGRTDPMTGDVQEGATWIYDNIERLATSDVTPYASPGNLQQ
jgi:eukaryotic-like serine/threonine-protein kinase